MRPIKTWAAAHLLAFTVVVYAALVAWFVACVLLIGPHIEIGLKVLYIGVFPILCALKVFDQARRWR